jgi:hypothetical protein
MAGLGIASLVGKNHEKKFYPTHLTFPRQGPRRGKKNGRMFGNWNRLSTALEDRVEARKMVGCLEIGIASRRRSRTGLLHEKGIEGKRGREAPSFALDHVLKWRVPVLEQGREVAPSMSRGVSYESDHPILKTKEA